MRHFAVILLTVTVALLLYGAIILCFSFLMRKLKAPRSRFIILSFLLFAVLSGSAGLTLWPADSAVLLNMPGVLLGDEIYSFAINRFGDPHSPQAHFTIPWWWRVPQVSFFVAVVFWGILGLAAQLVYNNVSRLRKLQNLKPSAGASSSPEK